MREIAELLGSVEPAGFAHRRDQRRHVLERRAALHESFDLGTPDLDRELASAMDELGSLFDAYRRAALEGAGIVTEYG